MVIARATELNDKKIYVLQIGQLVLQIGVALFYEKLAQTLLQIGAASLLQIGTSVVTNWGSYYILGQLLLQNRAGITNWGRYYTLGQLLQIGTQHTLTIDILNWGKIYYKLRQVLQIRAIITNWGITYLNDTQFRL